MTDPTDRDETGEQAGQEAPSRRPSPGAQAASRARRIGGRPMPGPRPDAPPPSLEDVPAARPAPRPRKEPAPAAPSQRRAAPRDDTTASMGARLLARVIDGVLVGLAIATLTSIAVVSLIAGGVGGSGPLVAVSLVEAPLAALLVLGYEGVLIGRSGATFGKRIVGISVVNIDNGRPIGVGRALLRLVVLAVTGSVLFLGYLSPLFNAERRGWHDLAGRDRVRRGPASGAEATVLPAEHRNRWVPALVVALVAYLLVGATNAYALSTLAKKPAATHAGQALRQQVLAAAKTCTARLLSYDYRTLPADEKSGQSCSTGQLRSDYTKLMDTTVKQIAPQNNVVQAFQVEKAGVQAVSKDGKQWVVLVYGQQQVTNKTVTSGPRLDISNAVVTLTKVGGQWLISNLTSPS